MTDPMETEDAAPTSSAAAPGPTKRGRYECDTVRRALHTMANTQMSAWWQPNDIGPNERCAPRAPTRRRNITGVALVDLVAALVWPRLAPAGAGWRWLAPAGHG